MDNAPLALPGISDLWSLARPLRLHWVASQCIVLSEVHEEASIRWVRACAKEICEA